jgi:hypothetical protein
MNGTQFSLREGRHVASSSSIGIIGIKFIVGSVVVVVVHTGMAFTNPPPFLTTGLRSSRLSVLLGECEF